MRQFQHLEELRQEFIGEAEGMEVEHDRFAVEQTHHHTLAVCGRHGRYAQIEFLALHPHHDPTVLRQAALGNVELGHDLDAADHGGGQIGRRAFGLLQHAIDPVAHLQPVLERFDVNVGGARLDRPLDDQIDQPDHRRFRGQITQVLDVILVTRAFFANALNDRAHRRAAAAVIALDQVGDFRAQTDLHLHRATGGQRHRLGRIGVVRLGGQHLDEFITLADRANRVLLEELERHLHAGWRAVRTVLG